MFKQIDLTSPYTHGTNVQEAQHQLQGHNRWDEKFYNGPMDGVYGRKTAAATRRAKFYLGYPRDKVDGGTGDIFGDNLHGYLLGKGRPGHHLLPTDYIVRKKRRAYELAHSDWHGKVIAFARGELHETENPPNSNRTKFNTWYYGTPTSAAWCGIFLSYCIQHVGGPKWFKYAFVPNLLSDGQRGVHGMHTTHAPAQGDAALFDWDNDGEPDHVEFFIGGDPNGTFTCIGGNTGSTDRSDGGEVLESQRFRSDLAAFVHIP